MKTERKFILYVAHDMAKTFNKGNVTSKTNYTIDFDTKEAIDLFRGKVDRLMSIKSVVNSYVTMVSITTRFKSTERALQVIKMTMMRIEHYNEVKTILVATQYGEQWEFSTLNKQTRRFNLI